MAAAGRGFDSTGEVGGGGHVLTVWAVCRWNALEGATVSPPIASRGRAERKTAPAGLGGAARERERGNRAVGPRASAGRARGRARGWAGRGRVRGPGHRPASRPGGEACSGAIPGAAWRGGRARAGAPGGHPVWGRGRAEGAPPGPGWRAQRRPPPAPPEPLRPAPRARGPPAPWTEAGVRGAAAPALAPARGGEGERRSRGLRGRGGGRGVGVLRRGRSGRRRGVGGGSPRARVDRCLLPPGQLGCRLVPRVPGPSALLCGRPVPHAQSQLQERMPRRIPEDSELLPPRAPLEG